MKTTQKYWTIFAIVIVGLVALASVLWANAHAFGINWDEAEYFDRALADRASFREGGPLQLARSIFFEDTIRPPAYRILALPLTIPLGFSPATVRVISIAFFIVSLIFVYAAASSIANAAAGAFAVIVLSLSPIMILSSMTFGTDYPLYLATAAVTYFLLRDWGRETESRLSWIGLGLALGLGALAKTSFALIAGPILAISFYLSWRKHIAHPSPASIIKAAILGTLIALPWWALNVRPALWYARYASDFVRHSLGGTVLTSSLLWVGNFVQGALGPLTAILLGILAVVLVLYRVGRPGSGITAAQKTAMWVCFAAPVPLVLAQLVGNNDNLGHISPALIPWSVGIGIILGATPWARTRLLSAGASVLFGIQFLMLVVPAIRPVVYPTSNGLFNLPPGLVMARYDQWDWEALRTINNSYGIKNPSISFLGNGLQYNWAQITYPWAMHNEGMTGVNWLWRYEDGAIDWANIMSAISNSDIVLTAPNYVGMPSDKEDLDNQYNLEFARRLSTDPRFDGPIHLTLGRFEPVDIEVFIKKADIAQPKP